MSPTSRRSPDARRSCASRARSAGVDIRGSATGTEEIATLDPGHVDRPDPRHPAGRRQRLRTGSRVGRAPVPGAPRRRVRDRRGKGADRARRDPVRSWASASADVRPIARDGRGGGVGRDRGGGQGRLRRRGHGRDRRQAFRHEAGDEVGAGDLHGHAARRRAGVEPGRGERAWRRAGSRDGQDRGRRAPVGATAASSPTPKSR